MCGKVLYVNYLLPGVGTLLTGNDEFRTFAVIHLIVFLAGVHFVKRSGELKSRNILVAGIALIVSAFIFSAEQTCNLKTVESFNARLAGATPIAESESESDCTVTRAKKGGLYPSVLNTYLHIPPTRPEEAYIY